MWMSQLLRQIGRVGRFFMVVTTVGLPAILVLMEDRLQKSALAFQPRSTQPIKSMYFMSRSYYD